MLNLKGLENVKKVFGEKTKATILFPDDIVECKLDPEVIADKYFADSPAINTLIKDFKFVEAALYDDGPIFYDIHFYLDNDKAFCFDEILSAQLESFYYEYENPVDDVMSLVQYIEGLKADNNKDSLDMFLYELNCEIKKTRKSFEEELESDLRELVFVEDDEEE